jgi:hypothetical protein
LLIRLNPRNPRLKTPFKNRFKKFLPSEEQSLGDAAGAVPDNEQRQAGNFVKRAVHGGSVLICFLHQEKIDTAA